MIDEDFQLILAHQLLVRLERLSADSYWAHRASGLRGSLLKCVEQIEIAREKKQAVDEETWKKADSLILRGFWILENAAREIRIRESNSD
jgi:hypothetical protein